MILLITSKSCSKCEMIKRILTTKSVSFESVLFSDLDPETYTSYKDKSFEMGIAGFPLIVDKCTDNLMRLEDLMAIPVAS